MGAALVAVGIELLIGIGIGLIVTIIGLFFGNIIVFDSIALAVLTGFLTHGLCDPGILLQEIGQLLADNIVHSSTGFAVTQFLLGLSLELRFGHLNTDNGGQPLTDILAG